MPKQAPIWDIPGHKNTFLEPGKGGNIKNESGDMAFRGNRFDKLNLPSKNTSKVSDDSSRCKRQANVLPEHTRPDCHIADIYIYI